MLRIPCVLFLAGLFAVAPTQADEGSLCRPLIDLVSGLLEASEDIGMSEEVEQHLRDHVEQAREHLEAGDEDQCVQHIDEALAVREFDV